MPSSNFTTTEFVELRLRSAPTLIYGFVWCHQITKLNRGEMVSLSLVKVAPVSGFDSVAFSSASMQMSSTIKELFVSKTSKDPCADMYEVISSMVL